MPQRVIVVGEQPLTIEDIVAVARGQARLVLSQSPEFRELIQKGARLLDQKWKNGEVVYGVTTGVGESCLRRIPAELVPQFSRNLSRFHGCGLGRIFDRETSTAILAVRLASLVRGFSGIRFELLERLARLIEAGVAPLIPEEGSVGASGDLTPLSYVAAMLIGERDVYFEGDIVRTAKVHEILDLEPLELFPKEGLALMNGTSVMTALAALAYDRAEYLMNLSARLTAMISEALFGNKAHFDRRIFEQKPHPGQLRIADNIAADLGYATAYRRHQDSRIQDTYAIRCAPHILGVLADALPWMRTQIETELNSANDNPLVDPYTGEVLHGGNFYGGHIAFVADAMKNAVANIADLLDRQFALLVNIRRNHGLPLNLSGATEDQMPVNHGFKALQIGCSAWAAEALKLTMPASVFSRSTESHNQDKVSMGTISARDAIRVLELTEQVFVGTLLAACQSLELRAKRGELSWMDLTPGIRSLHEQVRRLSPFVSEDRPLEPELRALLHAVRNQDLQLDGITA